MNKQAIRSLDEKKFKFYTYDPAGRDVTIVIYDVDQEEAQNKFVRTYGRMPIDMIEMVID